MITFNYIVPVPNTLAEIVAATLARLGTSFYMDMDGQKDYCAVSVGNLRDYELVVALKNFDPAMEVFEGQQYVVVNTSNPMWLAFNEDYPGEFPVMPGEEPHTYGLLRNAADCLADLMDEYEHTIESAPIFSLIPVPLDWVEAALKLVEKKEDDDENE